MAVKKRCVSERLDGDAQEGNRSMKQKGAENTLSIIQYIIWGIMILVGVVIITGQGPAALKMLMDFAARAGEASKEGTGEVIKNVIIPGS